MHVKVTNGKVDQYPYTIGQLRRDNPNTSFPKIIPNEILEQYGVFKVSFADQPEFNRATQKVVANAEPSLIDGSWVVGHSVLDLTQAEADAIFNHAADRIRTQRDKLLAESDWVVVMHTEKGANIPAAWEIYRQALRDVTDHVNFPYLEEGDWPVKP